jgi:hypothetical protein
MQCISSVFSKQLEGKPTTIIQYIYGRQKWFWIQDFEIIYGFHARSFEVTADGLKENGVQLQGAPPFSELCVKLRFEDAIYSIENDGLCLRMSHPEMGSITLFGHSDYSVKK